MNALKKRELIMRRLVLAVLQRWHGRGVVTKTCADWANKLGVKTLISVLPWSASMTALEYLRDEGLVALNQISAPEEEDGHLVRHVWSLTFDGWVLSLGLEPEDVIEEAMNDERPAGAGDDAGTRGMQEAGTPPRY